MLCYTYFAVFFLLGKNVSYHLLKKNVAAACNVLYLIASTSEILCHQGEMGELMFVHFYS
jgi:hypothetical protein